MSEGFEFFRGGGHVSQKIFSGSKTPKKKIFRLGFIGSVSNIHKYFLKNDKTILIK
ncbi:unnamed protein product [Meloidogyne enterolobii]|uniref:Uncharacterized protein n=1 Tax=Meloidogyne enterolobii TaxID=390850 RepID=A0ACB1AN05_MELEN